MPLLDPFSLAELHREVYAAILSGWVPYGQRGAYARRAGITREYLSLLGQLDHPARVGAYPLRLPSPAVAQRLADALPAPQAIRTSLLEHIEAALSRVVGRPTGDPPPGHVQHRSGSIRTGVPQFAHGRSGGHSADATPG